MFHDAALAHAARADPRPASAVSGGAGLAGLAGLAAWLAICMWSGMDGSWAALAALLACALPMIGWSLAIDRVHRSATTGIDWSAPRGWRETIDTSLVKLAGLWATWGAIALVYATCRFYWEGPFLFAMELLAAAAPWLVAASIPYVLWLDRYLVEPRDGAWAFGAWLTGTGTPAPGALADHARAWGVKGFFLAFMLAIVPGGFGDLVRTDPAAAWRDPVALAQWLIALMFVVDVSFATVGYVLTLRPLDAHIRSANPFAAAWMAALVCYPPFILMEEGGPLDYHVGTRDWTWWLDGHPLALAAFGTVLVVLAAIYAWATVAFGLRFSNLTHRGIVTHGPFAWSRHPAYLSKNLFWWMSTLPFLTTGSWADAARASALMAVVTLVYWCRAKTEERHLSLDSDYLAYSAWMARNAPLPRLVAWLRS